MSRPFKLKYNNSAFPFKKEDEPKVELFKSYSGKRSKIKTSLIGEGGITEEFGKKKLKSFGAIDLSKTLKSGGKFSLTGSKVLEPGANISAIGAKYTTPKGLSIGGQLSKGKFTETDPYEGKIITKGKWKPKLKLGYKGERGGIKISANPSLKSGKVTASLNIGDWKPFSKKKKRK